MKGKESHQDWCGVRRCGDARTVGVVLTSVQHMQKRTADCSIEVVPSSRQQSMSSSDKGSTITIKRRRWRVRRPDHVSAKRYGSCSAVGHYSAMFVSELDVETTPSLVGGQNAKDTSRESKCKCTACYHLRCPCIQVLDQDVRRGCRSGPSRRR